MSLFYSKLFDEKLDLLKAYLTEEFGSRIANESINSILNYCELVDKHNMIGKCLRRPDGSISKYRIGVIGYQLIIYEIIDDTSVLIVNMIDSRTNELSTFFDN